MLQYAVPNAAQHFPRPPSVFADPPSRPHSASPSHAYDIARPPSTTSQHSNEHLRHTSFNEGGIGSGENSSLSALAAMAAQAPVAVTRQNSNDGSTATPSSTPSAHAQTHTHTHMATQPSHFSAPASTSANVTPVCQNCQTSTTPLWRRDESGAVLCNACGLFLKLHGRPRPISLKTDVIKSRNRVKTSHTKKRDSHGGGDGVGHVPNGYPAAHPDVAHGALHPPQHQHQHGLPMGSMNGDVHHRAPSPASATNGDHSTLSQHNSNIAPQHIFDTVTLPSDTFASPSLPQFQFRQPSPAASSINLASSSHMDPPQSYDALVTQNKSLSTRVSELEVVNDLYRGRVNELEDCEKQARQTAQAKEEEVQRLVAELTAARARIMELEAQDGPPRKRVRTDSDSGDRSGHSTPGVESVADVSA